MTHFRAQVFVVPFLAALAFGCGSAPSLPSTPGVPSATPSAPETPEPKAASSAMPASSSTAAPAAEKVPDPIEAAPNNYKKLAENDVARVLEVTVKPGDKIPKHHHPDHAAYVVSAGKLKGTAGDAALQEMELKAGEGVFLPAQDHSAENTGKTEVKALVVELKGKTPTGAPAGPDPTAASKDYKKVFENDKVRILEATIKPGGKVGNHVHPDNVHYVIAGGKLKVTTAGQKDPQTMDLAPGQAFMIPAVLHSAENIGKTEIKVAVVEFKGGAPAPAADKPADKPADKKPADKPKPADKK
jgi:quercetin dioxygenase-like cupin family protein